MLNGVGDTVITKYRKRLQDLVMIQTEQISFTLFCEMKILNALLSVTFFFSFLTTSTFLFSLM